MKIIPEIKVISKMRIPMTKSKDNIIDDENHEIEIDPHKKDTKNKNCNLNENDSMDTKNDY